MKIQGIEWTSFDGTVLYKEVYQDGSKSKLVPAGFDTDDPAFKMKAGRIEREWIGTLKS